MTSRLFGLLGVSLAALALSSPAMAQTAPRVRGEISKVDGLLLTVKTRGGADVRVQLAPNPGVVTVVRASLADIKPNDYVGAAAMPQADGTQKALEVHIFPATMRGVGEGSRGFDLEPGSTMTNATVTGNVSASDGGTLTLTYPTGKQTIVVGPSTPIVAMQPGTTADLKPGAGIVVFGDSTTADGVVEAKRATVGKDGTKPPM